MARDLQTKISLATPDDTLDPDTLSSVEDHLNQMIVMKRLPSPILSAVDEAGTALWNTCAQAMRLFAGKSENMTVLCRGVIALRPLLLEV